MKPIYYSVILLLFISCKKNSNRWTEITIRVNNYITGEPIDDVTCGVGYYKSHTLKPDEWVFLDVGSPVNGVYHYEFKAPKAISYGEFSYDPSKYYPVDVLSTIYYDYGVNEYQMYLVPFGDLKTIVKNVNCNSVDDSITVYRKNINIKDYNGYSKSPSPYIGCYDNTSTMPYVTLPTDDYAFEWHVTKNGITNIYYDTITLNAGEDKTYTIEY